MENGSEYAAQDIASDVHESIIASLEETRKWSIFVILFLLVIAMFASCAGLANISDGMMGRPRVGFHFVVGTICFAWGTGVLATANSLRKFSLEIGTLLVSRRMEELKRVLMVQNQFWRRLGRLALATFALAIFSPLVWMLLVFGDRADI